MLSTVVKILFSADLSQEPAVNPRWMMTGAKASGGMMKRLKTDGGLVGGESDQLIISAVDVHLRLLARLLDKRQVTQPASAWSRRPDWANA